MSQILDAINKAEKQRQDKLNASKVTRETLYQSLSTDKTAATKKRFLPIALFIVFALGGAGYAAYHQQWLALSEKETSHSALAITSDIIKSESKSNIEKEIAVTDKYSQAISPSMPRISVIAAAEEVSTKTAEELRASIPISEKKNITSESIKIIKGKKPPELAVLTPVAQQTVTKAEALTDLKPIRQPKKWQKKRVTKNRKNLSTSHQGGSSTTALNHRNVTPSWKKNIRITAIMYHANPARRFVLIKGKKIYEGGKIPNSKIQVVKILSKNIIINDGSGDVMIR